MRQRLRNSELDVFEGEPVRLVANEGLAAAEKLGILTCTCPRRPNTREKLLISKVF
jgi:hypothetical protein